MNNIRLLSIASSIAFLAAVSCVKEHVITEGPEGSSQMLFSVYELSGDGFLGVGTKADMTSLSTLESSGFYLTSTEIDGGDEDLLFINSLFTKSGSLWSGSAFWPVNETDGGVHFYGSNVRMNYEDDAVTVSADNTTDVVCSYLGPAVFGKVNSLGFSHIFARLGVISIIGADGFTVSDVSVRMTPNTGGVYDLFSGKGHDDGTGWSSLRSGTETVVADRLGINRQDLLLVPGDYDVLFSWKANNGGVTEVFTDVRMRMALRSGVVSNYSIVLGGEPEPIVSSRVEISVDTALSEHDKSGSASSFRVSSRIAGMSGFEPTPWVTMLKDGDDWIPLSEALGRDEYAWLSSYPVGDGAPAALSRDFAPTVPVNLVLSHEDVLRSGTILSTDGASVVDNSSSAGAVDLSMYDFMTGRMETARYTANCYVVSSPGWYKFPLVYGNAIENSATNTSSYKSTSIGTGHLDGFKNYKYNLNIADPWIENDWYAYLVSKNKVQSVSLQWQQYSHYDEGTASVVTSSGSQGVIDNLSIVSEADGRYVLFHIDPVNIRPGNLLICAKDAGGDSSDEEGETGALTMWSWHIWICGFPLAGKEVSNGTDTYSVLPVNTGWVDGTKGLYHPRREAVLRFDSVAEPSRHSAEMTVVQQEGWDESVSGWGPYYQWGRKDPFIPGLFTYRANYDTGLRGAVRHPEQFNSERSTYLLTQYFYDWATNNYDNLWDSNWNKYGTVSGALPSYKTVMDPSPRRFCVAPDTAWDGFASYGHEGGYDGGYHFYTSSVKDGTIFFPGTGYIGYDSVFVPGESRYWTLHAWASMQRRASYSLRFSDSAVANCFYEYNHRASGQPVRSVRYN